MNQKQNRRAPYLRLTALVAVMIVAFLLTIGTGNDGKDWGGWSGWSGWGDWDGLDCELDGVSNTNFEKREPFSFDVGVVNQTQFILNGIGGNVTVTGIPGATSVIITGEKRVQSESDEDAQAHMQELTVNVQDLPNEVRVETDRPQCNEGRKYIVDYMITLPNYFKTLVNIIGGDVTVDSIESDVLVNNLSGDITITNIHGSAAIDLFDGTIEGEVTLPLNGKIDLHTFNGDINLSIAENTSAEFSSSISNGTITVTNLVLQDKIETPTSQRGRLGSGQGTITVAADQSGDISVLGF